MLREKAAQSFALVLHELTTNAVKYGALSVPAGRVDVRWSVGAEDRPDLFILCWQETGGPIVVRRPLPATGERSSKTRCGALASTRSNMRPRAWNFGWKRRSRKSAG